MLYQWDFSLKNVRFLVLLPYGWVSAGDRSLISHAGPDLGCGREICEVCGRMGLSNVSWTPLILYFFLWLSEEGARVSLAWYSWSCVSYSNLKSMVAELLLLSLNKSI